MATATRDSAATKRRLLESGGREFAAHGIAGARVERIAAAASSNKQLIYAYFGNKEGLFDAVLEDHCGALAEEVPFDPRDPPDYAGRLFDYCVEHPEVYRLTAWAGLERPTTVAQFEADSYGAKLDSIAEAQRSGSLEDRFAPDDLLAIVMAVAGAWFSAPEAIRQFDRDNPMSTRRLAQFREAAVEACARILGRSGA